MTRIKLCGLSRSCDIQAANRLQPDYIGFVFAPGSRRYLSPERAAALRSMLSPAVQAVGVFVNAPVETVAGLLHEQIIDLAQLHGNEDDAYIQRLQALAGKPVIKAFRVDAPADIARANRCTADMILLDSGNGGTGTVFDWSLIRGVHRPYFLAGGLGVGNVREAVNQLAPYAVDVSSGVETEGVKDQAKMAAFVAAVRKEAER